eukprot:TRINITY_DN54463_c0_g1_i3.p1 TRINITY_DN54463_c0_g1~~TRINITY_DN54463_c0_g1_i3.p1  ORF type:complete len:419 (+),score=56.64 TRINITY_DN54463_c0_g1_i3:892-2148(+)
MFWHMLGNTASQFRDWDCPILTRCNASDWFDKTDLDHNGSISFAEFCHAAQNDMIQVDRRFGQYLMMPSVIGSKPVGAPLLGDAVKVDWAARGEDEVLRIREAQQTRLGIGVFESEAHEMEIRAERERLLDQVMQRDHNGDPVISDSWPSLGCGFKGPKVCNRAQETGFRSLVKDIAGDWIPDHQFEFYALHERERRWDFRRKVIATLLVWSGDQHVAEMALRQLRVRMGYTDVIWPGTGVSEQEGMALELDLRRVGSGGRPAEDRDFAEWGTKMHADNASHEWMDGHVPWNKEIFDQACALREQMEKNDAILAAAGILEDASNIDSLLPNGDKCIENEELRSAILQIGKIRDHLSDDTSRVTEISFRNMCVRTVVALQWAKQQLGLDPGIILRDRMGSFLTRGLPFGFDQIFVNQDY